VFCYGRGRENAAAFAGRALFIPGPATIYAGFSVASGKILDLRFFHEFPPMSGSCSNFRPRSFGGTLGKGIGGPSVWAYQNPIAATVAPAEKNRRLRASIYQTSAQHPPFRPRRAGC
jgi:hypothetical protein